MTAPYKAPSFREDAFNCSQCGAYAKQWWHYGAKATDRTLLQGNAQVFIPEGLEGSAFSRITGIWVSECERCKKETLWFDPKASAPPAHLRPLGMHVPAPTIVFPPSSPAPSPSPDLPADAKRDFDEARAILVSSPRGAAALLRLCLQKLCIHLGEPGKNLNSDIGALVRRGLPMTVQQALDTVRVVGNEAVHPGVLDLRDDPETATNLFGLVNIVVDVLITQPNTVKALYDQVVGTDKKESIEKRDGGAKR